jgi:hypothetical protein
MTVLAEHPGRPPENLTRVSCAARSWGDDAGGSAAAAPRSRTCRYRTGRTTCSSRSTLRRLRQRPPPRARGLGAIGSIGSRSGPAWSPTWAPMSRWQPAMPSWAVHRPLRPLPALPGRPPVALRATRPACTWKAPSPVHLGAEGELLAARRVGLPDGGVDRAAGSGVARDHGRAPGPATVLVSGAGPIGALTIAALRAWRRRRRLRRARAAPPARREARATQVRTPDRRPARRRAWARRRRPVRRRPQCSGNNRAMEAALGQLERGGMLVVGNGMHRPSSTTGSSQRS